MNDVKGNGDFSIGSQIWTGLGKLVEEKDELGQVLGKLIGSHGDPNHYDGSNLRKKLVEEIGDLQAALAFFQECNMTLEERKEIWFRTSQKFQLFEKWHREGK